MRGSSKHYKTRGISRL